MRTAIDVSRRTCTSVNAIQEEAEAASLLNTTQCTSITEEVCPTRAFVASRGHACCSETRE
eukprot:1132477-Amphidinium_carterae.1